MADLTVTDIMEIQEDEIKDLKRQIAALQQQTTDLQDLYLSLRAVSAERQAAWRAYRRAMKQWDHMEGIMESCRAELQKLRDLREIE